MFFVTRGCRPHHREKGTTHDKVGARSWGAGAGIGAGLVVLGPAALGVGILGGTAAGGLHHKGLRLSDEDKARISADLGAGKAAVGVCSPGSTMRP